MWPPFSRVLDDLPEVLIDRLDQILDRLTAVYALFDVAPHTEPVAIGLVHIR
ncbi:hypothetical protein [Rhodococcus sp. BS-15]|uniref:hypothetical protein n=1 Tax=Rhodococcus sp. BS-15 TaxID=1304954 RepID=UPI000ACC5DAE|nr:hypothetical protein [Rhodococcus sp. BS-15]